MHRPLNKGPHLGPPSSTLVEPTRGMKQLGMVV